MVKLILKGQSKVVANFSIYYKQILEGFFGSILHDYIEALAGLPQRRPPLATYFCSRYSQD